MKNIPTLVEFEKINIKFYMDVEKYLKLNRII